MPTPTNAVFTPEQKDFVRKKSLLSFVNKEIMRQFRLEFSSCANSDSTLLRLIINLKMEIAGTSPQRFTAEEDAYLGELAILEISLDKKIEKFQAKFPENSYSRKKKILRLNVLRKKAGLAPTKPGTQRAVYTEAEELFFAESLKNGVNITNTFREFQRRFPNRYGKHTLFAKYNAVRASVLKASNQINDQATGFDLSSFSSSQDAFVLKHVLTGKSNDEIVSLFFETFLNTSFTQENVETFVNRLGEKALQTKTSFSFPSAYKAEFEEKGVVYFSENRVWPFWRNNKTLPAGAFYLCKTSFFLEKKTETLAAFVLDRLLLCEKKGQTSLRMFHIEDSQAYNEEAKAYITKTEVTRSHQPTEWTRSWAIAGLLGDGSVDKSRVTTGVNFGTFKLTQAATPLMATTNFTSHLEYALECFVQVLELEGNNACGPRGLVVSRVNKRDNPEEWDLKYSWKIEFHLPAWPLFRKELGSLFYPVKNGEAPVYKQVPPLADLRRLFSKNPIFILAHFFMQDGSISSGSICLYAFMHQPLGLSNLAQVIKETTNLRFRLGTFKAKLKDLETGEIFFGKKYFLLLLVEDFDLFATLINPMLSECMQYKAYCRNQESTLYMLERSRLAYEKWLHLYQSGQITDEGELPIDEGELPIDEGELPIDEGELPIDEGDF